MSAGDGLAVTGVLLLMPAALFFLVGAFGDWYPREAKRWYWLAGGTFAVAIACLLVSVWWAVIAP